MKRQLVILDENDIFRIGSGGELEVKTKSGTLLIMNRLRYNKLYSKRRKKRMKQVIDLYFNKRKSKGENDNDGRRTY